MDLTPPKPRPPTGNGRKLLASVEEVAAAADAADAAAGKMGAAKSDDADAKKLVVSDDPLDLSKDFPLDYRNWAAVLSQVGFFLSRSLALQLFSSYLLHKNLFGLTFFFLNPPPKKN